MDDWFKLENTEEQETPSHTMWPNEGEMPVQTTTLRQANEKSFYTAAFNPGESGFKQKYAQTNFELATTGDSEALNTEVQVWKDEQIGLNHDVVSNIITDQSLPTTVKQSILATHLAGGYVSNNLSDKFLEKTAALDNSESVEDGQALAIMQRGLYNNYQKQKDLDIAKLDWENRLSDDTAQVVGGMALDFVPGVWNTQNAMAATATAKYFGFESKEKFRHVAKAFFLGGSYTQEIHDAYNSILDPETKRDFFMHLVEGAKSAPGFDYNQWTTMSSIIQNQPLEWWEKPLGNIISIADTVGLGGFLKNPARWLKGLYTYQDSGLARAVMGKVATTAGKKVPVDPVVSPAAAKEAETSAENIASSPATGAENGIDAPVRANKEDTNLPTDLASEAEQVHNVQPKVNPMSPIGVAQAANPKQAREMAKAGILDRETAESMATTQGEVVGSTVLPKLDDEFVKNNPDLAKDITELDKRVMETFDESQFDPLLVNVTERHDDKFKLFKAFSETHGAHYQQANSSYRESLSSIEGTARYGKNADFGFTELSDATLAREQLDQSFGANGYTTQIINDAGQWYVQMNWRKNYDPFSARLFGAGSADSTFAGVNTSAYSKGFLAKWIFPATTRLPEWVTKGAFSASVNAAKNEEIFLKTIKNEIRSTDHPAELQKASEWTLENQKWMNKGELSAMFPNLSVKEVDKLHRNYSFYKRLTDYDYMWADRKHTADMVADGFDRGVYNKNGDLLAFGKRTDQVPESTRQVWDYETNSPMQFTGKADGYEYVKLRESVVRGNDHYEYARVGGNTKLDILPSNTLPRVEGYISRKNIEPWYITSKPKKLVVNGNAVDEVQLQDYVKTIAAGASRKEAETMMRKLQLEYPDAHIGIKQEKGDIGNSIITDYKVYKEMTDYGKKRGERLPTLTGLARLEDPLVQLTKSIQSTVRLNAWQNYQEIFQKNFLNSYGKFLTKGRFPSVMTDLHLVNNPSPKDLDDFKIAQRLFEQYSNQQHKINIGDQVWKDGFHALADIAEDANLAGQADNLRAIAKKGNLGVKATKSLANSLMINLNSIPQWIVQTQSILEFALTEKGFRQSMGNIPAIMLHILAKASDGKPYKGVIEGIANSFVKDKAELKALSEAIYKSGLPQGVDMNMMIHGGLDEMSKSLNPSAVENVKAGVAYIPDTANKVGKAIGYTPAQMVADIGGWLYAKARWEKLNPGKNWNTPEAKAQITADGWDIMGSMHTRAGALPYQDGLISVFFQFAAIQHKQFFNTFSSKTLKTAKGELVGPKAKLAAARMAIYGVYGVPAYGLVDSVITSMSTTDEAGEYHKYKGGLADLALNTTVDVFLSEPGDMPSDLALSDRIGPMPETLPYYDFFHELVNFAFKGRSGLSVPAFTAMGSIYEAATDIHNIFTVANVDTPEALQMSMQEVAELSSGFKNYMKAAMISEMDDKKNKFGKNLGLELTYSHAVAQMFGIMSRQEQMQYKMNASEKDREDAIEQRASQMHMDLTRLRSKVGQPEFLEWVRQTKALNTFTPPELQEEVFKRVMAKDKQSYLSEQTSNLLYIRDHAKAKNDKYIEEMIGYLKSCNSAGCQKNLDLLINNGFIK